MVGHLCWHLATGHMDAEHSRCTKHNQRTVLQTIRCSPLSAHGGGAAGCRQHSTTAITPTWYTARRPGQRLSCPPRLPHGCGCASGRQHSTATIGAGVTTIHVPLVPWRTTAWCAARTIATVHVAPYYDMSCLHSSLDLCTIGCNYVFILPFRIYAARNTAPP